MDVFYLLVVIIAFVLTLGLVCGVETLRKKK